MFSASIRRTLALVALLCLMGAIMNTMMCLVGSLLYPSQPIYAENLTHQYQDENKDEIDQTYPEVHGGGSYSPPNGTALHKVAIIVPYRGRQKHLVIFLNHMHRFLKKQPLKYRIFVVEQEGNSPFNRAKLMNVGFMEAGDWPCFIFHDIDLLPLDERNIYSCSRQPKHLSAAIARFNFKLPYEGIFGGVSALTREQFKKVNGFSNRYWGWGGEDDDMSIRLQKMNYHIARYKMYIARYTSLNHDKLPSKPNPKSYEESNKYISMSLNPLYEKENTNVAPDADHADTGNRNAGFALLLQTFKTFKEDGLSSLKYTLRDTTHHQLYTRFLVNIDEPKSDNVRISYYSNMLFGDVW